MKSQKYLNVEDKTCFWWKWVAINHGAKRPTKQIPYTWIFPDNFNLADRPEFLNEIVDDKKSKLSKDINYDRPSKEDLRLLRIAYYDKKII
jgi:hypothetical protein